MIETAQPSSSFHIKLCFICVASEILKTQILKLPSLHHLPHKTMFLHQKFVTHFKETFLLLPLNNSLFSTRIQVCPEKKTQYRDMEIFSKTGGAQVDFQVTYGHMTVPAFSK